MARKRHHDERGSIPDQPERCAADQSALVAQRLSVLGEMTGGIAHDFRNILAVIESGLRLVDRNIGDPDTARTFIAGAMDGVARGLQLTTQLLAFAAQKELPTTAADVNALLAKLELFLKYGAGSSVRIDLQLSVNLPKCLVDPSQFAAAILNLVVNARDAMPDGGKIEIATARRHPEADTRRVDAPGYVRVRVRDNGLGMTVDVRKKIFKPFFTTKGENGTGLGIPQVCAFVRHIGGRLSVQSEVGRGTTFDLFIPAVEAQARQAPSSIAPSRCG
jgi:signal transduction histidine kinase